MASSRQREMLAAGAAAPDFRLPQLGGAQFALQEQLSRGPVLLAFFKISCPVCQLMLPILNRIYQGGPEPSPAFFGVSQDDAEDTRAFCRHFGVEFPMLLDAEEDGYAVSNAYGISSVPSLFLIEPGGKISWALQGFSRREVQALGERAGVNPFRPDEKLPEWKAG